MNILFTHSDPEICAREHPDSLVDEAIASYSQKLLMAHKYLDGVGSRALFSSVGVDFDAFEVVSSPDLYWLSQSSHHYWWLSRCLLWLLVTHGKEDPRAECLQTVPYNMVRRGFKPPYPRDGTTGSAIDCSRSWVRGFPGATWKEGEPDWL